VICARIKNKSSNLHVNSLREKKPPCRKKISQRAPRDFLAFAPLLKSVVRIYRFFTSGKVNHDFKRQIIHFYGVLNSNTSKILIKQLSKIHFVILKRSSSSVEVKKMNFPKYEKVFSDLRKFFTGNRP